MNAGPLALSGSPAGGVYIAAPRSVGRILSGYCRPGTFTITYSYTDSSSCTGSDIRHPGQPGSVAETWAPTRQFAQMDPLP